MAGETHPAREVATLGGGCFWCLEAVFEQLRGVERVESGYAGGSVPDPGYDQGCTGSPRHPEGLEITFEPAAISFPQLLEVFFPIHQPTHPHPQGADVGTQYRSAVFCHGPEQQRTAKQVIAELDAARVWDGKIVAQVVPFTAFYPAEAYHQGYYRGNAGQPYCRAVIAPKVAKLR